MLTGKAIDVFYWALLIVHAKNFLLMGRSVNYHGERFTSCVNGKGSAQNGSAQNSHMVK